MQGRPIICSVKPEAAEIDDYEKQLLKIVYMLEKACALMFPDNEKWIWIMDLEHFSYLHFF